MGKIKKSKGREEKYYYDIYEVSKLIILDLMRMLMIMGWDWLLREALVSLLAWIVRMNLDRPSKETLIMKKLI